MLHGSNKQYGGNCHQTHPPAFPPSILKERDVMNNGIPGERDSWRMGSLENGIFGEWEEENGVPGEWDVSSNAGASTVPSCSLWSSFGRAHRQDDRRLLLDIISCVLALLDTIPKCPEKET